MLKPLTVIALTDSTFVPVYVPASSTVKTYVLQCDEAIDVHLSDVEAGSNIFTIKSGASLAAETFPVAQGASYVLCYAQSASGNPNLQILQVD